VFVIVDYDNIEQIDRHRGLLYLVEKIVHAAVSSSVNIPNRVVFRLYGGWYEGQNLSRLAQWLTAEAQSQFPTSLGNTPTRKFRIIASVALAYSLAVEPAKPLWDTFRIHGTPRNLRCHHPSNAGCGLTNCPGVSLYEFITAGHCPQQGCTVSLRDILHRSEQKLVDTMIAADMIHYSMIGESVLCVVSGDDDLWPGIRVALLRGTNVIHVHPNATRQSQSSYSSTAGSNYVKVNL
jgi:hypothetical protein